MITRGIPAAGKAIYEELRCGARADVPWEDIGETDQAKFIAAARAALAAIERA